MKFRLGAPFWLLLIAALFSGSPFVLEAQAVGAPAISRAPEEHSLTPGSPAILTVAATGGEPLSYQWYRGESGDVSSPVSGATGPLLVTPPLFATTRFWARVTNAAGAANSLAASVLIGESGSSSLTGSGDNDYGQLGAGFNVGTRVPVQIDEQVTAMSAGGYHTLFIKNGGALWATGMNYEGQLGDDTTTERKTPVFIGNGVVSVSAGDQHSLFIKSDGSLWAMGDNLSGQLGDGSDASRSTPVVIASDVAAISAGYHHSLFVKTDGSLWAMGDNSSGSFGNGQMFESHTTPVQVATGVALVTAGASHSVFVKTDGTLWTTGMNNVGQLGDGTQIDRSVPVQIATDVISVSTGPGHTLFVRTDGSLWGFGSNYDHMLGLATGGYYPTPVQIATDVASVSTSRKHTLFVKTDRSMWAVGDNVHGQLGGDTAQSHATPIKVGTGVVAVSAGGLHSLHLRPAHTVTFNLGAHGTRSGGGALEQTVLETDAALAPSLTVAGGWALAGWDAPFDSVTTTRTITAHYVVPTPPLITRQPASRSVRVGGSTTLSVDASGNAPATPLAYQWYRGETGNTSAPVAGATGRRLITPVATDPVSYWVRISNAGMTTDSTAATVTLTAQPLNLGLMGGNHHGQLGNGSTAERDSFEQISIDVVSVSAGGSHTLFIKADGSLWGMGLNSDGQLGTGATNNHRHPIRIATGVRFASAARAHSHFIKTDGTLWAMGNNAEGQLGDGTTTNRIIPHLIATQVSSVAGGGYHTLFVKTDGSLWATGLNIHGQLGDGSTTRRLTPEQVATGVAITSAGRGYSLILKTDASLWAVGSNVSGELGNNSIDPAYQPILVATDVVTLSAGYDHALFIKADGTLQGMGSDGNGQLGRAYGTDVHTPIQIETEVVAASAGAYATHFLKTDGALWSLRGESFTPFRAPVPPTLIASDVTEVSTGLNHTAILSASAMPTGYDFWMSSYELTAADALPDADPDLDGIPNLLEYAFATRPDASDPADTRPSVSIQSINGQLHLTLTHRSHPDRRLNYTYEKSTDLRDWTPLDLYPSLTILNYGQLHLRSLSVPISDEPRLFLRVSVSPRQ